MTPYIGGIGCGVRVRVRVRVRLRVRVVVMHLVYLYKKYIVLHGCCIGNVTSLIAWIAISCIVIERQFVYHSPLYHS